MSENRTYHSTFFALNDLGIGKILMIRQSVVRIRTKLGVAHTSTNVKIKENYQTVLGVCLEAIPKIFRIFF